MTLTRILPIALALASAGTLIGCTTAPAMPMPMGAGPGHAMASPDRMAAMDAQMMTMHEMHARMANAKTPEERQALMAEHMKAMQGGMGMMKGMAAMGAPKDMSAEMTQHHKMMMQHMAMMQTMMDMMKQRMPPAAGTQ
jgi:hypothetical protein